MSGETCCKVQVRGSCCQAAARGLLLLLLLHRFCALAGYCVIRVVGARLLSWFLKVDMRERNIGIAPQAAITKDNVSVEVSGNLYVQFTDPEKVRRSV